MCIITYRAGENNKLVMEAHAQELEEQTPHQSNEIEHLIAQIRNGLKTQIVRNGSQQTVPQNEISFTIGEQKIDKYTEEIDLSEATEEELSEFKTHFGNLRHLKKLELGKDNGENPKISWDYIKYIRDKRPDIQIAYIFTVHGYRFDLQGTILNLNHIKFDDNGELAIKIAKCMPNLEILDMDSCGVPDEEMAKIRDMFPDVHVVWRVFFGRAYSARTDEERLMISNPSKSGCNDLDNDTIHGLYYCNKVKYLDIGHLSNVSDCGYLANMPDLEVAIIAMTAIKRIEPIANCKHLNYLEFQTSAACDLTPLKDLKELRDLNICYDFALRDIRPIMDLDLDRLYIGCLTPIPREQIEKYKEKHPNCIVNTTTINPTEEEWRVLKQGSYPGECSDRYKQLYQEMQYGRNPLCYSYNENDRRYAYRFEY